MKKIKYLLGIGILGTLFSSCFGFSARYGSFNVFHSVNSELGNSSALLMKYYNMASFRINPSNYYSLNGSNNRGSSVGRMLYVKASGLPESAPVFDFSFYSPKGLSIALNSGIFFNLTESSYTFFGARSFNPTNGDTYPLIFSDSQDYLTFNNETTLAYNGQTYNYGNQGILKYCFYGVNYDLSCVFYSSDSYNLVNFSYNSGTDSIFVSSGYLIVPLHTITESACYSAYGGNATCGRFDGTSSLILKDVDDVVYRNIVNCYGSNYIIDNSCTVLSKGYINGLTSSQFFQRSFLTLAGGGTIQNGLGYFSEIFYDSSKFYYRSNSVYTSFTEGSPYTSMGYFSPYSELDLQNSDSAPDILNSINDGGNGNNNPGASYNSIPFSSLYYQCLGPTYNTPDGNPPAFCLNPDGTLINPEDYKDCFYNTTLSGGELVGHYFCDVGGYIQEMNWVSVGSGGYFAVCSSGDCGNYLVSGPSFIQYGSGTSSLSTGLIEDMFTNITGRIAKCPFPYTDFQLGQNFGLIKYFKSIGFNFDPFVLVNCVVAGFSQGRHAITNKAGLSFLTSPLISGDTDQHQALFLFLDFILILGIFGIITFLKKIF